MSSAPLGHLVTKNEYPPNYGILPFTSSLSNPISEITARGTADFIQVDATVTTANKVLEFPRNNSGESYTIIKDTLTIADSSEGTGRRLTVEFEIVGEYSVTDSVYNPTDSTNYINGVPRMKLRVESDRDWAIREIRTSLKDNLLLEAGGPVPRLVNGTFPFRVAGSTYVNYDVGQTVRLTTDSVADISYVGVNFVGGTPPPRDSMTFKALTNVGLLSCTFRSRMTRLVLTTSPGTPQQNPVITSASGFDYNSLLTGAPTFQIVEVRPNTTTNQLKLTWNSAGRGNFFRVRSSTTLNTPPGTWDIVQNSVVTGGPLTSITIPFSPVATPKRFFIVEER